MRATAIMDGNGEMFNAFDAYVEDGSNVSAHERTNERQTKSNCNKLPFIYACSYTFRKLNCKSFWAIIQLPHIHSLTHTRARTHIHPSIAF